ncbi:hypothetical protein JXL21_02610 [Candidatus Bathyarchaeota archaeon]|nr:hypothetical protein [Candidatus Bathyarchaeota archaeon]
MVRLKKKFNPKKRAGVSTILGVLMLIGILFSSILPLQIVMRDADSMKDRAKHEVQKLDQERTAESLSIYPLPNEAENTFNLTLINNCEVAINVNRIRVNNSNPIDVDFNIPAMGNAEVGPYILVPKNGGVYDIRVVTSRGNVFTSSLGLLYYMDGMWYSESLGFRLIFPSRPNIYARGNDWLNELKVTIMDGETVLYENTTIYWAISASEMFFSMESSGEYRIIVYTLARTYFTYWKCIYDDSHSITWPVGEPIVELKFKIDGDQLVLD